MFETIEGRLRQTCATTSNYMLVPDIRSHTGRKAYSYRGPAYWNTLDVESRMIENKANFKTHITKEVCRDVSHPG